MQAKGDDALYYTELTGSVKEKRTFRITLKARNSEGVCERELRLVAGDEYSLTPPMGGNTWGGLGPHVDEKGVRTTAEALVKSGLINHGYCYVIIDDSWQGKRGGAFNGIQLFFYVLLIKFIIVGPSLWGFQPFPLSL